MSQCLPPSLLLQKRVANVLSVIERSKQQPLGVVLHALGILTIGKARPGRPATLTLVLPCSGAAG